MPLVPGRGWEEFKPENNADLLGNDSGRSEPPRRARLIGRPAGPCVPGKSQWAVSVWKLEEGEREGPEEPAQELAMTTCPQECS